jgi:peptide deformylase
MAILKVYKYPHPVLRQRCEPVSEVSVPEIQQLISDMIETMYAANGAVGLAAPQVGQALRIVVMDLNAKTTRDRLRVLVNPVITAQSRNKMVREGCLSFPAYLANIKRSLKVQLRYLDSTGSPQEESFEGLEAVAVQHELDHLEGILLIDRIASLKTDLIRRQAYLPEADEEANDFWEADRNRVSS